MEGSGSEPRITDPDPDPEGPKTYGSYGSGAVTLLSTLVDNFILNVKKSPKSVARQKITNKESHIVPYSI